MRITDTHTFFYTKQDIFSNHYPARFSYHGIEFNCTEQFMMYAKAKTFKDEAIAQKILETDNPQAQKMLGRSVKNFNKQVWNNKSEHVLYVANREKYKQNPSMLRALLATQGTLLVEAARGDKLWGIGMAENDPGVDNPKNWKGQNRFGQLLTKLREDFILDLSLHPENEKKYLSAHLIAQVPETKKKLKLVA